ncbi:sorting nexin-11 [Cololabis saira]|uniref:sorting nexin-11 n=1 Tax=Cololabis saira TaxID=129043 RepID=UPI002AD3835E|nr:sorting nexin-11 [Cololabis saira]XP_061564591.1 sorting nexin-11 [Cololabis saira]
MIRNQEEDEFVAVRVQDPRIQNEGYWNSYVDYKIFLHTNSKAFTAKTSCVRRRYSEFAWLKKKLQKNAGLVPVPDLPGKSFFSFTNEDFLESRRKGLQVFLDKVVHMTVCLSDSQLHLFLQTQLPVGHIQDCVQGLTPYTVTDAILTYASSNQGLAQAQEENCFKESSMTVSYESMESPAPHQPCQQTNPTVGSELLSHGDSDPLEVLLELREDDPGEPQRQESAALRISQNCNRLEVVVNGNPAEATFYLGEVLASSTEESRQQGCVIQTPAQVHSPMGGGGEVVFEEGGVTGNADEEADTHPEGVNTYDGVSEVKSGYEEERVTEGDASSQEEEVLEEDESGGREEACPQPGTSEGSHPAPDGLHQELSQEERSAGPRDASDEDSRSLPSSNDSIMECSEEEESLGEDTEAADVYVKTPPEDLAHWSEVSEDILNLHINGCLGGKQEVPAPGEQDLQYTSSISELRPPELDPAAAAADGELTENSDFSILEPSSGRRAERDAVPSPSLGASEETPELETR